MNEKQSANSEQRMARILESNPFITGGVVDKWERHELKVSPTNYTMSQLDFKPIKTEDYELVVGYNKESYPILINVNEDPHVAIIGDTRCGKSKMLQQIITNMIANNPNVEFYLSQPCKSDLMMFKKYKNVKQYTDNLVDLNLMLNKVCEEMKVREVKINDMIVNFNGDSIFDYNKLNENKMNYIYVTIDEYAYLIADYNCDSKEGKLLKMNIHNQIKSILQFGRQCGIQLIISINPHGDFYRNSTHVRALIGNKLFFNIDDEITSRRLTGNTDSSRLSPRCFKVSNSHQRSIHGMSYNIQLKDIAEVLNNNQGATV